VSEIALLAAADRPEVVALLDRFLAGKATPVDARLAADFRTQDKKTRVAAS
jgi:hypothetical protein